MTELERFQAACAADPASLNRRREGNRRRRAALRQYFLDHQLGLLTVASALRQTTHADAIATVEQFVETCTLLAIDEVVVALAEEHIIKEVPSDN